MRYMNRLSVCVFALGAMACASAAAAEVKLKAASFLPPQASFGWPFARWVENVNRQCDGKIEITSVGPEAIKAFEQPNALKTGVVDMLNGPPAYYKGIMVEGDTAVLAEIPPAEMRKNGAWDMLDKLHQEKVNAKLLTFFGDGVRFYIWTKKPARDGRFDGMTLRSAIIYDAFFRGLGANTTTMEPSEVYTALERGAVDGYGWPLWGLTDFGWHKFTKHRYEPGFFNVVVNVLVNLDKYRSLTEEQRECLDRMALWGEEQWADWRNEHSAKVNKELKGQNIDVVDLGPQHRKKAHDLYWAALEKDSPENVKKLRELLTR